MGLPVKPVVNEEAWPLDRFGVDEFSGDVAPAKVPIQRLLPDAGAWSFRCEDPSYLGFDLIYLESVRSKILIYLVQKFCRFLLEFHLGVEGDNSAVVIHPHMRWPAGCL